MGEHREKLLAGQVCALEAERDRSAAEIVALKRVIQSLLREKTARDAGVRAVGVRARDLIVEMRR